MQLKPIITEKSMSQAAVGVYSFMVNKHLSKPQIAQLVSTIYQVEVVSVKTAKTGARTIRTGRRRIPKKIVGSKKAYVAVKPGQKIEIFEIKN